MTIIEKLEKIIVVIEEIEMYYIKLSEIEINGDLASVQYQDYFQLLIEAIDKEKELLSEITTDGDLKPMLDYLNKILRFEKEIPIILNHSNSSYFRLRANLESLTNEESLDYAHALKYDLTNIILSFLSHIIDNPYYESIRSNLIWYKYSLICNHWDIESNFILGNELSLALHSKQYQNSDFYGAKYVNRAILVLESTEYLTNIANTNEFFKNSPNAYTNIIIAIINVLARFILCDDNTVMFICGDLESILEDEQIDKEVKDTINEMFDILEKIKDNIYLAR